MASCWSLVKLLVGTEVPITLVFKYVFKIFH
jgi:hypothetical protein